MAHLSEEAKELCGKYQMKFKKYPRSWAHGEETMKEYEEYLRKELENTN